MDSSIPICLQTLATADLEPIVCQILKQPVVEILGWQIQSLEGGASKPTGHGLGVYRLTGIACYSSRLRDAGWEGDLQLARFAHTVNASLTYGIAFVVIAANMLQATNGSTIVEAAIGQPFERISEQWQVVQPFLLDLGDEALQLMRLM